MLRFFFDRQRDRGIERLYAGTVAQARSPVFYQKFAVADTVDGRFEMLVLHVGALVDRLRGPDGAISPAGQALFDAFLADMDQNLRTMGVGDMSVPKKMKRIGSAFYGRFDAYRRAGDDCVALAAALARNVYDDETQADAPHVRALAAYHAALVAAAAATLDPEGGVAFPEPAAFLPADGAALEFDSAAAAAEAGA